MTLDEQSQQLTHSVVENQQNDFNTFFYGLSIGKASLPLFLSETFRALVFAII